MRTEMQLVTVLRKIYKTVENNLYLPVRKKMHGSRFHEAHGVMAPLEGEVIWIDPCSITGHMLPAAWHALRVRTGFNGGALVAGEWDITSVEHVAFTSMDPFISCHDHWIRGKRWEETPLFDDYRRRLKRGESCRFASPEKLQERYDRLDDIFHTVVTRGEMSTEREDLVKISVARDGSLIWGPDGRHRVCIAICAGIERMPALTGFVHAEAIDVFQSLRAPATKQDV